MRVARRCHLRLPPGGENALKRRGCAFPRLPERDRRPARVARRGTFMLSGNKGTKQIEPKLAQVYLEEEGDQADDTVNVTKFQNFASSSP